MNYYYTITNNLPIGIKTHKKQLLNASRTNFIEL